MSQQNDEAGTGKDTQAQSADTSREPGGRPGWVKGTEEKADRGGETKDLSAEELRKRFDEA